METDELEQLTFSITQIMKKVKEVELERNPPDGNISFEDFQSFQVDLYNQLNFLRHTIVKNHLKK